MKVVLTCGHPYSGFLQIHQAMLGAGLKPAKPSKREQLSPEDIQAKLCLAHEADTVFNNEPVQLIPGKAWQNLSTDLFMANLDQEMWGWADAKTIYLLNYWRNFDPQSRFVLAYSSPAYALAQLIREETSSVPVEELLLSWAKYNAELLSFYNRNMECSILVNVEAFSLSVEAKRLFSISNDRLGTNFPEQTDWCKEASRDDVLLRLIASSLTRDYPMAQSLYKELESAADINCDVTKPQNEQVVHATAQYRFLDAQHKEALALSIQQKELENENELLRMQLHQVQEEAEHYFLKFQEMTQNKTNFADQIVIDFCQTVDGYNWYDAEVDGRWGGPGKTSTLRLPKVKPGRYQIELKVVDAMSPEILKGTKFSLNGIPLKFLQAKPLKLIHRLVRKKIRYPVILTAHTVIGQDLCNSALDLEFEFPAVISPFSRGRKDKRHLALRMKTVTLKFLA